MELLPDLSRDPDTGSGQKNKQACTCSPARNAFSIADAGGKEARSHILRKDYIERKLLGIAFWKKDSKILEKLPEAAKKYENTKEDLIFEAEVFYTNNENLENSVQEMFLNLEIEFINEELNKKMLLLKQNPDQERGKIILKEINELNKKKEDIKNGRLKK